MKKLILILPLSLASTLSLAQSEPVSHDEPLQQQLQLQLQSNSTLVIDETLLQQRLAYEKINQLSQYTNQYANNEAALQIIGFLLKELEGYPLYPYAKAKWLKAHKNNIDIQQLQEFYLENQWINQSTELKERWLAEQYEQKNWQLILNNQQLFSQNLQNQCIFYQAEWELGKKVAEPTALLMKLAATKNLAKSCVYVVEKWYQQIQQNMGAKELAFIQELAILAFENTNINLLNIIEKFTLKDGENRFVGLSRLVKDPNQIFNRNHEFYIENLQATDELHRRILSIVIPRLLKEWKETDLNEREPFQSFTAWANKFNLSSNQITEWKVILLNRIFDTDRPLLQKWRDRELTQIKEDKLTERRLRMAIREQQDIGVWLNILSSSALEKEEWRFWQAKNWQKQGKLTQANKIWQGLLQTRSFYAMLAAEELKVAYMPPMQSFQSTLSSQQFIAQQQKNLSIIQELHHFQEHENIQQAWRKLLEQATREQKLILAQYANEQKWFDLQVEATIQAKAWDMIALRLPNAYLNWFDLHLNQGKIDRTFAMAIARQESAWKTQAVSSANARGLMQLLPSTAKLTAQKYHLPYSHEQQLFSAFDNIMLGTAHLNMLAEKYGSNRILIAAAYNAGAKRVDQWLAKSQGKLSMAEFIASIPFYETRGYVQNVLTYDYYYQILQQIPIQKFKQEEYNRTY